MRGRALGTNLANLGRPTSCTCTARSRSTNTVESSRLHGFRRTARKLSSKCSTVGFIKVRPQQWGTESVGSVIRRIRSKTATRVRPTKPSTVTNNSGKCVFHSLLLLLPRPNFGPILVTLAKSTTAHHGRGRSGVPSCRTVGDTGQRRGRGDGDPNCRPHSRPVPPHTPFRHVHVAVHTVHTVDLEHHMLVQDIANRSRYGHDRLGRSAASSANHPHRRFIHGPASRSPSHPTDRSPQSTGDQGTPRGAGRSPVRLRLNMNRPSAEISAT